jgi:uncharacterized protein (TIGR00369 family)
MSESEHFRPQYPGYEAVVRESFARQAAMRLLGATLVRVDPGAVDVRLAYREELTQQHGYVHAGVLTAIADTACGYAALTLMGEGSDVLTAEFKINLLRPGRGETFVAEGRVVRPGRRVTVSRGDVYAHGGDGAVLVATMLATIIGMPG